jgi:hypothetical protein
MIKPGVYKNAPDGWSIALEGPDKGTAFNPVTGQRMDFIEFLVWTYGISREQAILEIMSAVSGKQGKS